MAVLAFAGAGAMLAPSGYAVWGWMAGSVIGNYVMREDDPKADREKCKYLDMKLSNSAYGIPRPLLYGMNRVAGNVIWCPGITEEPTYEEIMGRQVISGFKYTVSFAVAFGEASDAKLVRLFTDGQMVFGSNAFGGAVPDRNGFRRYGSLSTPLVYGALGQYKWYTGAEDQLPDSTIQAVETIGRTPAYRGTCYLVVTDYELPSPNLPNLEAEVIAGADDMLYAVESDLETPGEGSDFNADEYASNKLAIDFRKRVGYLQVLAPSADEDKTGLRVIDLNIPDGALGDDEVLSEIFARTCTDSAMSQPLHDDGGMCVLPNGDVAVVAGDDGSGDDSVPVILLSGEQLEENGRFGENSGSSYGWHETTGVWHVDPLQFLVTLEIAVHIVQTTLKSFIFGATNTSSKIAGIIDASDMTHVWSTDEDSYPLTGNVIKSICRGATGWIACTGYIITGGTYGSPSAGALFVYKLSVSITGVVTPSLVGTLTPGEMYSGETSLQNAGHGLQYDSSDDTLIFAIKCNSDSANRIVKYDPDTDTVTWTSEAVAAYPGELGSCGGARLVGSTYSYINGTTLVKLDTADGSGVCSGTIPTGAGSDNVCVYDSRRQLLYGPGAGTSGLVMWPVGRYDDPSLTADDIFADLCGRVGLEAADISTAGIATVPVRGYGIGRQTTARSVIEDIMIFNQLFCVEVDNKLKFYEQDDTSVITIPEDDLIDRGISTLIETRIPDIELPLSLNLNYIDRESDYQQGSQPANRIESPQRSVYGNNHIDISTVLVATDEKAKQQAEKLLHSIWTERVGYSYGLGWKYSRLASGDVVTLEMNNGTEYLMRLTDISIGNNRTLSVAGISLAPAQYDSDVSVGSAEGFDGGSVPNYPQLRTFVVDMPHLDDEQEPQDRVWANMLFFVSRTRESDVPFERATIWQLNETGDWIPKATVNDETSWGRTTRTMTWAGEENGSNPVFQSQGTVAIPVMMVIGEPNDDCTTEECLNGENRVIVIFPDGICDLIYYASSTLTGEYFWLSDTLRGMRGTDVMSEEIYLSNTACTAIFLDPDIQPTIVRVPYESIGTDLTFRVTSYGQPVDEADSFVVTPIGRSIMPYHPRAEVACRIVSHRLFGKACGDIRIEWQRRTRVGGQMEDKKHEAPLFEDFEAYELEIYAPTEVGRWLARTVYAEEIIQNQYTYTYADQLDDMLGPTVTSLWLKIYQLSAQLGRGFSRRVEVQIHDE